MRMLKTFVAIEVLPAGLRRFPPASNSVIERENTRDRMKRRPVDNLVDVQCRLVVSWERGGRNAKTV
jgi:hypothetical protein